ncbi:MAG: hypothetical protein JWP95_1119 [Actinotalea sp.]|nr:hypothetical protein [Actinotalea sp.]
MTATGVQAPRRPAYLRTAATPRMVLLLVLMLLAAAVCARLGVWQLDRAQIKGWADDTVVAEPGAVPLDDVLAPQSPLPGDLAGRAVQVRGTFGADDLLVPGRVLDGRTGFLVLTPLTVSSSEGTGEDAAVLPVVRGWVADEGAARALDPAPAGPVEVVGLLQAGEAAGTTALPEGQVQAVSPAELVNRWGGPIYSAYLVVQQVDPAQDPALAVLPPPATGRGDLDLQSLAYALQWWIFGGFALLIWARLVRDEAREAVSPDPSAGTGAVGAP